MGLKIMIPSKEPNIVIKHFPPPPHPCVFTISPKMMIIKLPKTKNKALSSHERTINIVKKKEGKEKKSPREGIKEPGAHRCNKQLGR